MKELSRRSLSWLCVTGFVLAGAGWTVAWKNGQALQDAEAGPAAGDRTRSGKAFIRDERTGKETPLMSDPRSNRLISMMVDLEDSAEPGKPNPKFLKAAEVALNDSLFHRRQRDFRLLMEKMRPEDAKAIHDHFKSLERDGRYFGPEYAAFATRWGQVAGADALNHWLSFDPVDRNPGNLVSMMTGWGTAEPEKALAWVEEHQAELGDMNPYRPLLVGWINTDPMAATAWLQGANLDTRQVVDCVGGAMLDKVYSDGLEGASEWLASLPDDKGEMMQAARFGWLSNVQHLRNLDPQIAANAWSKVGNQSWITGEDFQRFCGAVADGNGGSLEDFAKQLGSNWSSAETAAQFERWSETDPDGMVEVLAALPPSSVREAGMEGLFRQVGKTDPTRVEEMRKQIMGE